VWLDANVFVSADITGIVAAQIASGVPVGAIAHPERHSVYQEGAACLRYDKDDPTAIREQLRRYDRLGFDCSDLIESNFLTLDLRHPAMARFLAAWWREIERDTHRDQLSVNHALRKTRLSWRPLVPAPHDLRSHPSFALLPHGDATRSIAERRAREAGARAVEPKGEAHTFAEARSTRILAQRSRVIDIVVCVKDALEDVRRCLQSVLAAKTHRQRRIVVVDDGSGAATRDYLTALAAGQPNVTLVRNEGSRGYTRAANQGLRHTSGELVILLNSDTIVSDWWAEKLADALFTTPGAGLVGPLSNAASWQSIPSIAVGDDGQSAVNALPPGATPAEMDRLCEEWTGSGIFPRVPLVHGFCLGISRSVINRIGYFDEHAFPNAYGEENDYCLRATDAGFDAVIATSTYVFHAKTRSYTPTDRAALARAGQAALVRLFGAGRVRRATAAMAANPTLVGIRGAAERYYGSVGMPAP
jgi:GT2 family glycosyltransferase